MICQVIVATNAFVCTSTMPADTAEAVVRSLRDNGGEVQQGVATIAVQRNPENRTYPFVVKLQDALWEIAVASHHRKS